MGYAETTAVQIADNEREKIGGVSAPLLYLGMALSDLNLLVCIVPVILSVRRTL